MNNKELIASELAKVIDSSWPRCYFKFAWTTKIIWSWWHCFSSLLTCKSGTQGSSSNRCRYCWKDRPKCLRKVVATGPYVNFFLDKSKISDQVIKSVIEAGANYGQQDEGHGQNITIDLSSPNIAKPFSVGHLRSTVIGDALSNIFRKMGYNTIKINHLGTGVNSSVSWW